MPEYWQRLVVRPGLTGFAQTRMGREQSWSEKLAHDLEWIADRSVRLYLRIVAATAWRVLRQSVGGLALRVARSVDSAPDVRDLRVSRSTAARSTRAGSRR